jgi:hypothetical protein
MIKHTRDAAEQMRCMQHQHACITVRCMAWQPHFEPAPPKRGRKAADADSKPVEMVQTNKGHCGMIQTPGNGE